MNYANCVIYVTVETSLFFEKKIHGSLILIFVLVISSLF